MLLAKRHPDGARGSITFVGDSKKGAAPGQERERERERERESKKRNETKMAEKQQ